MNGHFAYVCLITNELTTLLALGIKKTSRSLSHIVSHGRDTKETLSNDENVEHVFLLAELGKHLHKSFIGKRGFSVNLNSKSGKPLDIMKNAIKPTFPKNLVTSSIILKFRGLSIS